MNKIKLLALAMGLSLMALTAGRGAAEPTCQEQCQISYEQCQEVCSQNPCFFSCDARLDYCLSQC